MTLTTVYSSNEACGFVARKAALMKAGPRASGDRSMKSYVSDVDSDGGVECPTCERIFDTENGMKTHHAQKHGESIAGVEVICDECGGSTRAQRSDVEEDGRNFCNEYCYWDWMSADVVGVVCSHCDDDFQKKQYRAERDDKHFCKMECYARWQSDNLNGEKSHNWDGGRVSVSCEQCGDGFEVWRYQTTHSERNFCPDKNCYGEWRSENLSGPDNPQWKGGRLSYGEGWDEQLKEKIRDRQNRYCAGCGVHESELSMKLDVHHIQKARSFDDDEARNDESNLVAICRVCHNQWEQMSPLRPQTPHLD